MLIKHLILVFILVTESSWVLASERAIKIVFPEGELFEPLVADPKEAQFSAGLHRVDSSGRLGKFNAGVVSYGEYFGLLRWQTTPTQQWQISLGGALFGQFNMDADSKDLVNADYTVGLAATNRRGPLSYRFRILHQSTHLGDELLLGESAPERVNYSLEAVDFLSSYRWDIYRIYGGMGYLLNVEPRGLDRVELQLGGEFRQRIKRLFPSRWIGGVDLKAYEGDNWDINATIKAGLEFGKSGSGNRRLRVMLEHYQGKSPFGQFYEVEIESFGITCYLLF